MSHLPFPVHPNHNDEAVQPLQIFTLNRPKTGETSSLACPRYPPGNLSDSLDAAISWRELS